MPKSREILLLSNLILATWYLILLDLQKIPTSSHRSLYNCTSPPRSQMSPGWRVQSGRRPEGRDTSMPRGKELINRFDCKKTPFRNASHLPAKKYSYHGLSISYYRSHMINLWVICDFTSIHTSQWKQINVSLGCPSILRIKLPTGRRRKSRNACKSWSDV